MYIYNSREGKKERDDLRIKNSSLLNDGIAKEIEEKREGHRKRRNNTRLQGGSIFLFSFHYSLRRSVKRRSRALLSLLFAREIRVETRKEACETYLRRVKF